MNEIIDATSSPYEISNNQITIGTSIGISIYPDDSDNSPTLVKFVDEAMYEVKSTGKNNFIYYQNVSDKNSNLNT